jgi:hypothetical protein
MCVGVAVALVVDANVGAHPLFDKNLRDEPAGEGDVLLRREFHR